MNNIKSTVLSIITLLIVLFIVNYAYISISKGATNNNDNSNNNVSDTNLVYADNLYILKTSVMEVNDKSDVITVITDLGEMYQFYDVDDWQINDKCLLIMDNNGTDNVTDDIIVKTVYTD